MIIFVLIYFNTRSVTKTFIVLLAVPFSLIGAFWMLYLLGYHMSVAVWVGLIALAGLDAETGVVMLLYLDHAWDKHVAEGRMASMTNLYDAVKEGAVQRIRPKIMTVCAILFGLLPIMWSPVTQAGADVMKRIAAPMIGGVVTSAILELLIYPVIYVIWRRRQLPEEGREDGEGEKGRKGETENARGEAGSPTRRFAIRLAATALLVAGVAVGGYFGWQKFAGRITSGKAVSGQPFATETVNELTVKLLSHDGQLHQGDNDITIEFRNAAGESVDVGTVKFELNMKMPGMQMHSGGPAERGDAVGQYCATIKADMAGDWSAKLTFEGPQGKGEKSFSVNVK